MSYYLTPAMLRERIEGRMRQAGFADATVLRFGKSSARYFTDDDGEACLRTAVHEYASVFMSPDLLDAYASALAGMPGLKRTEIVRLDEEAMSAGRNPLRAQVVAIFTRALIDEAFITEQEAVR